MQLASISPLLTAIFFAFISDLVAVLGCVMLRDELFEIRRRTVAAVGGTRVRPPKQDDGLSELWHLDLEGLPIFVLLIYPLAPLARMREIRAHWRPLKLPLLVWMGGLIGLAACLAFIFSR